MEAHFIEEKNTASLVQPKRFDIEFQVSAVFNTTPVSYFLWSFDAIKGSPFFKKEIIGTTVFTIKPEINTEFEGEDFEIGYYNDDYDIVAKAPVKKTFNVKVKIKSVTKHQPKTFIDFD